MQTLGSGFETLRHLVFSDEVKRTFLARWAQLSRPYIGLHVRSTDRTCPEEKMARVLRQTRKLKRSKALKGANVLLATDNPEQAQAFRNELEGRQRRRMVSFTFQPGENDSGEYVPLHLNRQLGPAQKHQTNLDSFVDLLLLALSDHFIMTCGGYSRLANFLHKEKKTALALIGETLEEDQDPHEVVQAAWERMQQEQQEQQEQQQQEKEEQQPHEAPAAAVPETEAVA